MTRHHGIIEDLYVDSSIKVDVPLFVELMSSALAKCGAGEVIVDDVSGGKVTFFQGGAISIPVHVCLAYKNIRLYFSFKAGTPLSIPKRLFQLETEASRQQLVAEMLQVGSWQIERINEGVKFTFQNALQLAEVKQKRRSCKQQVETMKIEKPQPKLRSTSISPAMQRPQHKPC